MSWLGDLLSSAQEWVYDKLGWNEQIEELEEEIQELEEIADKTGGTVEELQEEVEELQEEVEQLEEYSSEYFGEFEDTPEDIIEELEATFGDLEIIEELLNQGWTLEEMMTVSLFWNMEIGGEGDKLRYEFFDLSEAINYFLQIGAPGYFSISVDSDGVVRLYEHLSP